MHTYRMKTHSQAQIERHAEGNFRNIWRDMHTNQATELIDEY